MIPLAVTLAAASLVATPGPLGAPQGIDVLVAGGSCTVRPTRVEVGEVGIAVRNLTPRPATFVLANERLAVGGRHSRARRLAFAKAGRRSWNCRVGGRSRRGSLDVVLPAEAPLATPRIGVRNAGNREEFFDRATGARFIPRGNTYTRLGLLRTPNGGQIYHSTFQVAHYDALRADRALKRMADLGYNVVKTHVVTQCIDGCLVGFNSGELSTVYLANLADFIRRANKYGLLFVPMTDGTPRIGAYGVALGREEGRTAVGDNAEYLTPGGIEANELFWRDLIIGLARAGAPLDAIFAYQIREELSFRADLLPLNRSAGTFIAPNGSAYDLGSAADRARLLDDAVVYWGDRVRAAIRAVAPNANVTVGFFEPHEPNRTRVGDPRLVAFNGALRRSTLDFVNIHPYPGIYTLSLPRYMENFGISGQERKPVVMGEFGTDRASNPTVEQATTALVAWQIESCLYGIDGWLLWTWDTAEQTHLWAATSAGGRIASALSPRFRPDPCSS